MSYAPQADAHGFARVPLWLIQALPRKAVAELSNIRQQERVWCRGRFVAGERAMRSRYSGIIRYVP